jgi:dolichol-phosphate mannosyltransferase
MRIGKFALVGLSGLAIGEILLYVFTEFFGLFYVLSGVIGLEVAVISNFIAHEIWTFADRERKDGWTGRFAKYNVISIAGMALNTVLLFAFTEFLGVHYLISFIIAAFAVFNWNYFINLKKTWKYERGGETHGIGKDPLVSIVIPTYNEKENIGILIPEIFRVLGERGIRGEVVVVDDNSPDGTWKVARDMGKEFRVNIVRRKGKLGLASAVMEGFREAEGEVIGVMDADLSHPPEVIPDLVKPILSGEADLTVGSRYVKGGETKGWPFRRKVISRGAGLLAKLLTGVKDPTSGFFFFNRGIIKNTVLNPSGYKIGLEIFVKGEYSKIKEMPYTFIDRKRGESKLNLRENMNYLKHLVKLYWYKVNR